MASITGSDGWSHEVVQHIPKKDDNMEVIENRLYMEISPYEFLHIEIVRYNERNCLFVHRATKTHNDSIILSNRAQYGNNILYGMGNRKINKLLLDALETRSIYYSTNEVGSDFKNYIRIAKQNKYDL